MYEGYPKETIDKIKELGLYGKTLDEIILISVQACSEMLKDVGDTSLEFKKNIGQLQNNQINLIYKLRDIKKTSE